MGNTPDDLWAVWPYAGFPYLLCGEIEGFNEQGYVRVKGYQGRRFKPSTGMSGYKGRAFQAQINAMRSAYYQIKKEMASGMQAYLVDQCLDFGVPTPLALLKDAPVSTEAMALFQKRMRALGADGPAPGPYKGPRRANLPEKRVIPRKPAWSDLRALLPFFKH